MCVIKLQQIANHAIHYFDWAIQGVFLLWFDFFPPEIEKIEKQEIRKNYISILETPLILS